MFIQTKYEIGQRVWVVYRHKSEVCVYDDYIIEICVGKDGRPILLTKDHIYPKSKGGLNNIKNYQVLCEECNNIKSDNSPITLVQALRGGYATKKSVERAVKLHKPKALVGV